MIALRVLKLIKLPTRVMHLNNSLFLSTFSRNLRIKQSSKVHQIFLIKNFNRPQINTNIYRFASNVNNNNVNKFSINEEKYKETKSSWIDTYLPSKLVPYALLARLDKPIGTWLLYLPCS